MTNSPLLRLYRALFLRRIFYKWHKRLFFLALSGLGMLNYHDNRSRPEIHFLEGLLREREVATILDVGAHVGSYASQIMLTLPRATVHAFEPHPRTFPRLQETALQNRFQAWNLACGDYEGKTTLYDYRDEIIGSEHASLHEAVVTERHSSEARAWDVSVTTVDAFLQQQSISQIDLLKIDTEGNELKVLQGAQNAIATNCIDVVQFEFNEMNVVSRVFFKDIYDALTGYDFYRMLPDGLVALGAYSAILCELFTFHNVVAIRRGALLPSTAKHLGIGR